MRVKSQIAWLLDSGVIGWTANAVMYTGMMNAVAGLYRVFSKGGRHKPMRIGDLLPNHARVMGLGRGADNALPPDTTVADLDELVARVKAGMKR